MARVAPAWDALGLAAAKVLLGVVVLGQGFVALSDDDYSRTVIAQGFAHAPSFDPSRTSWLPLPFWVHGAVMALLGRSLAVAHGTALVLGVVSALCVHRAARWLGASRPGALVAAVLGAFTPTAARLGVSTQPEALAAGLVLVGAAAIRLGGRRRVAGAAALCAASLCRYEAWAAAAVFALMTGLDAMRAVRFPRYRETLTSGFAPVGSTEGDVATPRQLAVAALLPLLGPLWWVFHGAVLHGDALFFLHRVAAYRRALGVTEPLSRSLLAYPAALIRREPEVTLSAVMALRIAADRAPVALSALARPALVVASTFAFLVVGRVLDGAPTHHAERTLLPLWMLLGIVVGEALARSLLKSSDSARGDRVARAAPFVLAIAAVSWLVRHGASREPYAERAAERAVGTRAREVASAEERLAVDTPDLGYFAVIAAFGAPEHAVTVDEHDPRRPRAENPFDSEEHLRAYLARARTAWLVAAGPHRDVAQRLGEVVTTSGELSLVRLTLR
jgi:hypothetical protein